MWVGWGGTFGVQHLPIVWSLPRSQWGLRIPHNFGFHIVKFCKTRIYRYDPRRYRRDKAARSVELISSADFFPVIHSQVLSGVDAPPWHSVESASSLRMASYNVNCIIHFLKVINNFLKVINNSLKVISNSLRVIDNFMLGRRRRRPKRHRRPRT